MPPALRRRSALSVALTAAAVLAGPAHADAPTPKSKTIVPVVSIGGLKLGRSYATALRRWGPGSSCATDDVRYREEHGGQSPDRSEFTDICDWPVLVGVADSPGGAVVFDRGKVTEVQLRCHRNSVSGEPAGSGPIGKFTLRRGKTTIRCGSRISALRRAFPSAEPTLSGVALFERGRALAFGADQGKVAGIALLYAKNF